MALIHLLVEGDLDSIAGRRILEETGHSPGISYGKKGIGYINQKIEGFNNSAHDIIYLTLVDFMDTGLTCPAEVVSSWLPHRNPKMHLRVVVRELESWLLADRSSMADFLKVSLKAIPSQSESIVDPKQVLVNLARKSRVARLRSALVPEQGSTASVGKLYVTEMSQFITKHWNISAARAHSPSLDKCLKRLEEITE